AIPAPANEYDTELAAIQADLNNPNQYKADVSNLATTAHVQEVEDKVDVVDGVADAIKLKTDNLPADPADASVIDADLTSIEGKIDALDTVADGIATTLASPNNFKADVSGLALESTLDEMKGAG